MNMHKSVMPREVIQFLKPVSGGRYLDGTLGLGGHSLEILKACDGDCYLMGMDLDDDALGYAAGNLSQFKDRINLFNDSFDSFSSYLEELGWDKLDGVVLDLGVSSLQLDVAEKGFSFIKDGPLDMRMGRAAGFEPASRLLERISLFDLKKIIGRYGEEPMAGRVARAIINVRDKKKIETTLELAQIVENAYPAKRRAMAKNHPATKTFQALRVAVNRELDSLESFLKQIVDFMRPGARIVVISFHSLEDRIVKHFFKHESKECICPPGYPVCQCEHKQKLKILTKKPLVPKVDELADNPRSRSAKLRASEKTA